jgi:hypothetical protein
MSQRRLLISCVVLFAVAAVLFAALCFLFSPPSLMVPPAPITRAPTLTDTPTIHPTITQTATQTAALPSVETVTSSPTIPPTLTATQTLSPTLQVTDTATPSPTLLIIPTIIPGRNTLPTTGGSAALYAQATGDISAVIQVLDLMLVFVAGFYFSRFMDAFAFWRDWKPEPPILKRLVFLGLTALLVGALAGIKQGVLMYFDTLGPVFQTMIIAAAAYMATQIAYELNKSAQRGSGVGSQGTAPGDAEFGKMEFPR